MERLTQRDEFGNADTIGVDSVDLRCNLGPDEFNKVTDALNKLAEYEDLEEQGKLLKLPYAVGDTIYSLNPYGDGKIAIVEVEADAFFCALTTLQGRLGKSIFLTCEEAEKAVQNLGVRQ